MSSTSRELGEIVGVEHQIEQGFVDGGFFAQPLVDVTRVQPA